MSEAQRLLSVVDIARQAGALIEQAERTPLALKPAQGGGAPASPVTRADLEAEGLILEKIVSVYPDVPVVAEEAVSSGAVPASARRMLFIDPLDGTKEFLGGHTDYTVNIALVEDGRPVMGVVYAPAREECYVGMAGLGAFRLRQAEDALTESCRIAPRSPAGNPLRIIESRSHKSPVLEAFLKAFPRVELIEAGSSLKFCLLAAGEVDLYPRFGRTMEWDTAAGDAVLRASGGATIRVDGADLTYDKRHQASDSDFANPFFVCYGDAALGERVRQGLVSARASGQAGGAPS